MDTLFFGKNVIRLDSVDSTNDYLRKLAEATTIAEGTVVITRHQISGKGQRGSTWESEAGKNLTFSVFLQPKFLSSADHFMLNKMASLAVSDAIKEIVRADVKIKWPNDILINGRKTAGILIENSIGGNSIQNSVVGIGLNVNQTAFDNLPDATSLLIASHEGLPKPVEGYSVDDLLFTLCSTLEKRYLQLRGKQTGKTNSDYLASLYLLNKEAEYVYKKEKITATLTGVSALGKVQLVKTGGETIEADFKEIVFMKNLK